MLAILLMVALASCGDNDERPLPAAQLRIATGLPGGVYRVYGTALAIAVNDHVPRLRAKALTTEGSVENLQLLDRRGAEIAFTLADTAQPALHGTGPFSHPVKIAALARLYDDYVQVIARKESQFNITELAGKTVSIGAPGSGTALTAKRILKLLNLRGPRGPHIKQLTLKASADALAAGRIDAFFWSGGLPTQTIDTLTDTVPIRLIELPAGVAARLDPDLYTETRVPRYVYDLERAVRTVAAANLLVVRQDMPDEKAFRITRLVFEHQDELERKHAEARRLSRDSAIDTYPLDLHPGAVRWYQQDDR